MESHFSSIYISLPALVGGLVFLVAGGEALVSGAVKLATRLGMSSVLIGLTVVAFGTSMPEFFVSLSATIQDQPDIMLGNIVGSNIANIGLILGCCALLSPLTAHFRLFANELYMVIVASLTVAGLAWYGHFSRPFGLLFIFALILFTWSSFKNGSTEIKNNENQDRHAPYWLIFLLCGGGLAGLAYGSNLFIAGAIDVALFYGVSNLIIGLTMAAMGTSLPELASSISAIRRKETDLLMGNIIGSNLFNLLMVLGGIALIKPFDLGQELLVRDLPVMILFSAVLLPLLFFGNKITRLHGFLLLSAYGLYMVSLTF